MNNIDSALGIKFGKNEHISTDISEEHISNDSTEERDDPLNEYRQPTNVTCLQCVLPDYPVTIQQNVQTVH